jgi:phytoene dehydrogenase-like protein
MHLDFGPDVSGGATFPFVEPPTYHAMGMPIAQGGVQNIIESMASCIREYGGHIHTGQWVERIVVRKGRAVGVRTSSGYTLNARRSVIANVSPIQLVSSLVENTVFPNSFVKKCQKYRFGPGTMMIHLAMNKPLQWAAGDEFCKFNYVHVGPYVEDIADTYTQALNRVLPASPLLIVGQLSTTDPSRVPDGQHLLWIQVRAVPYHPLADAWQGPGEIHPGSWDEIKERYADRILAKLEKYAPGMQDNILQRVVYSPRDLERANPNLTYGDSIAGSHHWDQFYMFRPFSGSSGYKTPLKDLYVVGASTWPGAGVHGTSGYLLGKSLLQKKHIFRSKLISQTKEKSR